MTLTATVLLAAMLLSQFSQIAQFWETIKCFKWMLVTHWFVNQANSV